MIGVISGLVCAFMVALRSVIYKDSDLGLLFLVPMAGMGLMLFSWMYFFYHYWQDPERYHQEKPGVYPLTTNPFRNVFLPGTILASLINFLRYFAEFAAIYLLPIGISVPLLALTTFSSYYFDYMLQGTQILPQQYLGGILSVIGAILLNWEILKKKEHKTLWYKLGITCLLFAILSEGYLLTRSQLIIRQTSEEEAFVSETTFSGLLMLPLLFVYLFYLRKKLHQSLPKSNFDWIVTSAFFFLVPLGVYFRLLALKELEEIFFVLLLNLSGLMAMIIGSFIWNEKIKFPSLVGAILVMIAVWVASRKKESSLEK